LLPSEIPVISIRVQTGTQGIVVRFRPWILAVTGAGGLLVILYLMLFKPSF